MSRVINFFSTSFVVVFSLPVASFAAFTTWVAFTALVIRIGIIYIHLFLALVQAALIPSSYSTTTSSGQKPPRPQLTIEIEPNTQYRHHARRRTSSASSSVLQTPALPHGHTYHGHGVCSTPAIRRNQSLASLVGAATPRDYESLGGWRPSGDDDDDALWAGINSRLELPALTVPSPSAFRLASRAAGGNGLGLSTGRRASLSVRVPTPAPAVQFSTGGQRTGASSGSGSPELRARSPSQTRRRPRGRRSRDGSGDTSPEGYFGRLGMTSGGITASPIAVLAAQGAGSGKASADSSRMASRRGSVSLVKVGRGGDER